MTRVELLPYDDAWRERFTLIGGQLRASLGDRAVAIHHIGSTAVVGLAAKDVVDVQVTVADLEPWGPLRDGVEASGLTLLPGNDDARKRFFKSVDGDAGALNCHIRLLGCPSQGQALLFRDYLRADLSARERYEQVKRSLAEREWMTVEDYADAKGDVVWQLLREADRWSWNGWRSPPTDA